jgi:hypothetical protein
MDVKCFETSTMIPVPTTWPAREVPAVRGISDVFSVFAKAISFSRSFFDFGIATASGISLYRTDGAAGAKNNVVVNNTILVSSVGRWALNISDGSTGNAPQAR